MLRWYLFFVVHWCVSYLCSIHHFYSVFPTGKHHFSLWFSILCLRFRGLCTNVMSL